MAIVDDDDDGFLPSNAATVFCTRCQARSDGFEPTFETPLNYAKDGSPTCICTLVPVASNNMVHAMIPHGFGLVLSRFPKETLAFYVYLTWMESIVWKWAAPFSSFLSERGISIATTRGIRNYAIR